MDNLQKRKTCKRYNDPGNIHFLTFTCFQNQPFLLHDTSKQWLGCALTHACDSQVYDLLGYVFMPTHVHLIVSPRNDEYNVSKFLTAVKKPVALRAKKQILSKKRGNLSRFIDPLPNGKQIFRFWQRGGGYDRNIVSQQELREKIDYIHNNPVKAGLCKKPEDWFWSSAAFVLNDRCGPITLSKKIFEYM